MIKFYFNNLLTGATITSSSENAQFKAKNVKDDRRTKVFRSTSNADSLTIDIGENAEMDSFFIVDNPKDGFGVDSLSIHASSSPSFTPDLLDEIVSLSSKYGQGFLKFDPINARYFKIEATSTLPYCELSNFFIGKEMELMDGKSINFGWTHQESELITKSFNRYGQQFSDLIGTQRIFNISFTNLTKDQLSQLDEMFDYVGTHTPFFVRIGCPDIQNELERYAGMVFMVNKPTKTNTFFNRYSLSMTLSEAK